MISLTCKDCGVPVKPLAQRQWRDKQCRVCHNKKVNKWYKSLRGRWSRLKSRGCTASYEEFSAWYACQKQACAICRSRHRPCVDHDHDTGVLRGLLCPACNYLLGWVEHKTPDNHWLRKHAASWERKARKYLVNV